MISKYLVDLVNQVSIQENEVREIKTISDELFIILKINLTFFQGFRVYGSITRGTSLSPTISRKSCSSNSFITLYQN